MKERRSQELGMSVNLMDDGNYEVEDYNLVSTDPLKFTDQGDKECIR
jgi:hypothetical protein